MTPAAFDLIERHIVDVATQAVHVGWLADSALAVPSGRTAAFLDTLKLELDKPTPVGPVSFRFRALARLLTPEQVEDIARLGAGPFVEAFAEDIIRAGIIELGAARDELASAA